MRQYPLNAVEQELVPWPFEGESSNYKTVRDNPQASGRIDVGTSDGQWN